MRACTIGEMLNRTAFRLPEKVAVKHEGTEITYGDLFVKSARMADTIKNLGITPGDRVGIYMDKCVEQLVAMFGISMAGAVFVFINPILKKSQIEHIIKDCQIGLIIGDLELFKGSDVEFTGQLITTNNCDNEKAYDSNSAKIIAGSKKVPGCSGDIACLIYTSGSTGMPKGVVVPQRTLVDGAEIVSDYLGITEQEVIISILPFNFDYGLNQALSAVFKGATLVLHRFVFVKDLLSIIDREKITGLAGMPPIWNKLFNDKIKLTKTSEFSSLRYITNSGGKVPLVIVNRIREFFPQAKLFLMYGLTEAFRSTYLPPEEIDNRPGSIGKAIPDVEIMVVDSNGKECPADIEGELVHRGALVTLGYWNDPEKTNAIFRKNPRLIGQNHLLETVVYSGDIVKKDKDGFLYFVSRRDEMIKTSGFRVSPTEVEEVLIGIPGISNVVVFGKEVASGDQIIVAVVESDGHDAEKKSILLECKRLMPGYMVPGEIYLQKTFPKTANGKIDRSTIKKEYLK